MSATEIIEEIKHLSPGEQEEVVRFVHSLRPGGAWSPDDLTEAASALAAEIDPARSKKLKEQIIAGFYAGPHA